MFFLNSSLNDVLNFDVKQGGIEALVRDQHVLAPSPEPFCDWMMYDESAKKTHFDDVTT